MTSPRGWSWLRWLALWIAALLHLAPAPAQADDPLSGMPSVAKVKSQVTGSDPFDTAARQSGAFKYLRDIVTDLSDGRDVANRLTQREVGLMSSYVQASFAASRTAESLLAQRGAPKSGADSPGPKTFRASEHYHYDPSFRQELLRSLLSPALVQRYESATAARRARARAPLAGTGNSTNQPPRNATEWLERGAAILSYALGPIGARLALVAAGILGLSYPLLAFLRSRRVGFWSVTGPVTGSKTWSSQNVHHTPGYTDTQGIYRQGSSYTTSARHDEFFIQEGQRSHSVTLRNVSFAVDRGHSVTAVWVGSTRKAKSWWVARVRNHATGDWAALPSACRRVRGSSLTTSSWWTFLVFTPACGVAYLYAGGGEPGVMLVAVVSSAAFSYWFWAGSP